MKTLKVIVVCVVVSMLSATLLAQEIKTPEEKGKMAAERLDKEVTLTPEQKDKVEKLATIFAEKRDSINVLREMTLQEKVSQKKGLFVDYKTKVNRLLTSKQKSRLAKKKKERKEAEERKHRNMKK